MKPIHLIVLLLMNLIWATVYSAYKIIGETVPASTGCIVTLRFGLAGICLLLVWPWLPGKAPRGKDFIVTCVMGVMLYVVGQRLQVYGNQLGTASNSAVLMGLEPVITSVAAALILGEHIGPRRWTGFVLGMAGVGLLNGIWRPGFQWSGLTASSIFVSSFICEAVYSVIGKKIIMRAGIMKMIAVSLLVGLAINLLIDGSSTLSTARYLPLKAWLLVISMAIVCTAIGYSVWFRIIRHCSVNVAALTIFAQSIFGVILAAAWLGETLRWEHLIGSFTILAGLVFGLSRQIHREPAT
jgi:drug/metabolite transporter (DMT)-like permease